MLNDCIEFFETYFASFVVTLYLMVVIMNTVCKLFSLIIIINNYNELIIINKNYCYYNFC